MGSLCRSCAIFLLAAQATSAGIVTNGGFEKGLFFWNLNGGAASNTGFAHSGTNAIRITGRAEMDDGIRQTLTNVLVAAGSGLRFTTRFWIHADAWVSARAILLLTDDANTRSLILAEKMVTETGRWVEVESSQVISFVGTLSQARLYFDVGQYWDSNYPSYFMDDVSVETDADGDKLTDAEEAIWTTDVSNVDTDSDGVWDGYETRHDTQPLLADSGADDDGDGFTRREEYWAATDPTNALSYPGKPANAHANGPTRELLRWLALLPSQTNRQVLAGQHSNLLPDDYTNFVVRLAEQTGRWPGLACFQYEGPNFMFQITNTNPHMIDYWTNGGLVLVKWNPYNPWTSNFFNDTSNVFMSDLTNTATLAYTNFQSWLTGVGDGLTELRDAGLVVLWRFCSEMTAGHFWWGARARDDYLILWNRVYNYLTHERGLDNLIWVYESHAPVHPFVPVDYYYPGADHVDVLGHNFYSDTWKLPFDADDLMMDYPKIYGYPQAGPNNVRDGSFDELICIQQITSHYHRCSFFAAWNSFGNGTNVSNLSIVDNVNSTSLMQHAHIVTRDELDWMDDGDADGLPDWWEVQFAGSVTNGQPDADSDGDGLFDSNEFFGVTSPLLSDTDGDGAADADEWTADTYGNDSNSQLSILALATTGDSVRVTWRGGRRATQTLLANSNLAGSWTGILTSAPPTAITNAAVIPAADFLPAFAVQASR